MNVAIQLSPQAQAILQQVPQFPAAMQAGLVAALDQENEFTIGAIQRTRLSKRGPETLGVVTNRLRGSVARASARALPDGRSVVSAIGSNVAYAGVHEYGYRGPVAVRQHERRRFTQQQVGGNAYLDPKTGRIRKSRKRIERTLTGTFTVRAHTRKIDIKARAPFRRGILDRASAYTRALSRAIVAAWRGPIS